MASAVRASSEALPSSTGSQLADLFFTVQAQLSQLSFHLSKVPGSQIAWRYFKASHQNDPFRTLLELALVFFIIRTYAMSRTKGESGKNFVKLNEKEIDELVSEWSPEPLIAPANNLSEPPIVLGSAGPRPRIIMPSISSTSTITLPSGEVVPLIDAHDPFNPLPLTEGNSIGGGKQVLNLASPNFAGLTGNDRIKDKAIACMRRYGIGSCGPPGFYGTFDVHMELERDLQQFLQVPAVIIYAHSFSTISSVIPSFSKRGDIIVADKGVNFAIQKGIQISRSTVRWYEHGDYEGLERVLEGIRKDDIRFKRKPTDSRRFIITEGIFENDGSMVDLPKVMELKLRYKYRLMLDESWSFGSVGRQGRGVTEVFDIPAAAVDILTGSMAIGLCSTGGFCAGSLDVVHHQRINSPAFVYSAALPPLLAVASSEAIAMLSIPLSSSEPKHPLSMLRENLSTLRHILDGIASIDIPSAEISPLIHLFIKPSFLPGYSTALMPLKSGTSSTSRAKSDPQGPIAKGSNATRDIQEHLLQDVVNYCAENGVLLNRTRRNWDQELYEHRPSLRLCVSSALTKKEMEKAGNVIKTGFGKTVGKVRR